jgi:tousled-like kinase
MFSLKMKQTEDNLSTSISDMYKKVNQLEARFTGPLNPAMKSNQEAYKYIQPTLEKTPQTPEAKLSEATPRKNPRSEDSSKSQDFGSNSCASKKRKNSSPIILSRNISQSLEDSQTPCLEIKSEISSPVFKEQIRECFEKLSAFENLLKEKNIIIQGFESKIAELGKDLEVKNEMLKVSSSEIESLQELAKRNKKAVIKILRQLEEKKRQELKARLFNDSFRLGRVTMVRSGTRFQEYWEDGQEITQTKAQLDSVIKQKESLEKQKKKMKKSNDEEFSTTMPLRIALLMREEIELKEKLDKLEIEKNIHIQDCRRMAEEDSAKYSKSTSDYEAWPVLHGRYILLSLLGKGGYSEVYRAYDLFEHIDLAIKFHELNPSWSEVTKANYIKHALRENKIHRELNNARIVKHYDTLEVDNNCFCTVLEFCPGEDLHMYMKKHKTITEKEAKSIMQQIFAGLKYLNEQPEIVIHYDLKPHNILLNNGEVKITDFGLSKIMDEGTTDVLLTSQGVGTYWYQAPECFETGPTPPKINSKVDVWSAGVIFFELLYAQKPFGNNMPQKKVLKDQVIVKATTVNFPPKPNVSNECKDFIRKCLEYNVEDRWDVLEAYNSSYLQGKR